MKLTFVLITIACLQVSAKAFSQRITISKKNAPLTSVLDIIQQQSGYDFFYNKTILSDVKVNVDLKNATITQALDEVFKDSPFSYIVDDKTITVSKKDLYNLDKVKAEAKISPVEISGKVVDEQKKPLQGVTIIIKGSKTGIITNENGLFSFIVPNKDTHIIFSYVGFETQEIAAKDLSTPAFVVLKAVSTNLKEVVINKGYYSTTEELNTGDVTTVKAKDIENQPVSNVLEAIQNRVPGLFVTQASGIPGAATSFLLRGQGSINNGSQPLVLIDGVPFSFPVNYTNGSQGVGSGTALNYLNPSDIESVTVLKDADATAIYGSKGSAGVILITTKKGVAGATKLDVNFNQGYNEKSYPVNYLNTQQYLAMRAEAFKNDGESPGATDYDVNGTWDRNSYTDWEKVLTSSSSHYTNAQLSLSGGTNKIQYLISGDYRDQNTTFPGDFGDKSGALHFNLTSTSPNGKLITSFSASYLADKNVEPQSDPSSFAATAPDAPSIYTPQGNLNWANSTWYNPYAGLLQFATLHTNNLISNLNLDYKVLPGLDFKTTLGYTNTQSTDHLVDPLSAQNPSAFPQNSAKFLSNNNNSWIANPQINYTKTFGKGTLNAVLGSTLQSSSFTNLNEYGNTYSSDLLLNSISGAANVYGDGNSAQDKSIDFFGDLNYNWDQKYIVNLTANRDASSRFGPGHQFGNFGSAALGWIFSKEDFIKNNLPFLSFGKLRASYGTTGNDQIGDYQYLSLYNPTFTQVPYQGASGLSPTSLSEPNYSWEVDKKLNLGIDLGFFNDRILIKGNYYRNRSSDQLGTLLVPAFVGPGSITANLPALVQNSGVDLTLSSINIKGKDFSWSTDFNISHNANKLLAYPNFANSGLQNEYIIGQSLSAYKVYHSVGVNPTTGVYQFVDHNGNLTYTPDYNTDRTVIENRDPDYFGGIGNNFVYKSFRLNFFLSFVKTHTSDAAFSYSDPGTEGINYITAVLNRWQKPGDHARYEMFSQDPGSAAQQAFQYIQQSDYNVLNGSTLTMKTVALSYNLPDSFLKFMQLKGGSISLNGQNLFTIYPPHSADYQTGSVYSATGILRTYTLRVSLTL